MGIQLVLGTAIIVATAIFLVICLVMLASLLTSLSRRQQIATRILHTAFLRGVAVLTIIGIHTVEA